MLPDPSRVPSVLRDRAQWVNWAWVERDGKLTKPPYCSRTFELASVTDPTTWSTLAMALRAAQEHPQRFAGIGFVLGPDRSVVGLDLDHCRDEAGEIAPWALAIVERCRSYTEITPSGCGLRIFLLGQLPPGQRRRGHVECYDSARYLTVTGDHLPGTPTEIRACSPEEMAALHSELLGGPEAEAPAARGPAAAPVSLDDQEVVERMLRSREGARIGRLMAGDSSDYGGDESAADMALANYLVFWTSGDVAQADRIFRNSGRMREKWDRRHSSDGRTYGQMTLDRAMEGRTAFYRGGDGGEHSIPDAGDEFEVASNAPLGIDGSKPTPDLRQFTFDDLGNARRLIAQHGENVRFVPEWKSWLAWNGRQWRRDTDGEIFRLAAMTVDATREQLDAWQTDNEGLQKAIQKHRSSMGSRRSIEAMERLASSLPGVPVHPDQLDANLDYLPCANGVVDLRTGELLPHSRKHMQTKCLSTPYVQHAQCPTWDRFFAAVFRDDQEMIDYVWRVLGYTLSGRVTARCFFILHGEEGKNGKSTLVETWGRILEQDVFSSALDVRVLMEQRYQQANQPELATLPGIRFVYTSEASRNDRFDVAKLKLWTGGDTLEACQKHERPFTFRPQFKLLIATNYRPEVGDIGPAMWDRVHLWPFLQRFSSDPEDLAAGSLPEDTEIGEKLLAEAPGALARAVRGAIEFYEGGLRAAPSVIAAVKEYQRESDHVGQFVEECCDVGEGLEAPMAALYARYRAWCDAGGRKPENLTAFGRVLSLKHFEKRKTMGNIFRVGLALRPSVAEESSRDDSWADI